MKIKHTLLLASLLPLAMAGCTTAPLAENMVASSASVAAVGGKYDHNLRLDGVTGGSETNAIAGSANLGNTEFSEALQSSLARANLTGASSRYALKAHIADLDKPFIVVNAEVGCDVEYEVTDIATGASEYKRRIATTYTAQFFDSLNKVSRIRMAIEGCARKNIQELVGDLTTASAPE